MEDLFEHYVRSLGLISWKDFKQLDVCLKLFSQTTLETHIKYQSDPFILLPSLGSLLLIWSSFNPSLYKIGIGIVYWLTLGHSPLQAYYTWI